MYRRKWWIFAGAHGFPVGLGYSGFNYFVIIWLKQLGFENSAVTLGKLLLLPLLLRTMPLRFFGVKSFSLRHSMVVLNVSFAACMLSFGNPWVLGIGSFAGCVGVALFEAFFGLYYTNRSLESTRRSFMGGFFVGYRCSKLFSKGICVYVASLFGWSCAYGVLMLGGVLAWCVLDGAAQGRIVVGESFFSEIKKIKHLFTKRRFFVFIFCLLPDAFFECMIIPFWMDREVSLAHIALSKGVFSMGAALFGSSISLWFVKKGSLIIFFKRVIPLNIILHTLPVFYDKNPHIAWVYVVSFAAQMGHSLLASAYYICVVGEVQNSRQYEIYLSGTYIVTFLSSLSGPLWGVLSGSWSAFFFVVAASNILTFLCLHEGVSRETS